jgi:hypothetical protein
MLERFPGETEEPKGHPDLGLELLPIFGREPRRRHPPLHEWGKRHHRSDDTSCKAGDELLHLRLHLLSDGA